MLRFVSEEETCRSQCEDVLDWSSLDGDNPEISIVITSIFTSVLRCKNSCALQLSMVNGRRIPKFMASFFEYQHVCEFNGNKVGRLITFSISVERGVLVTQSVANALLLDPDNILMRRNKFFYMKTYGKIELFQPSLVGFETINIHNPQTTSEHHRVLHERCSRKAVFGIYRQEVQV